MCFVPQLLSVILSIPGLRMSGGPCLWTDECSRFCKGRLRCHDALRILTRSTRTMRTTKTRWEGGRPWKPCGTGGGCSMTQPLQANEEASGKTCKSITNLNSIIRLALLRHSILDLTCLGSGFWHLAARPTAVLMEAAWAIWIISPSLSSLANIESSRTALRWARTEKNKLLYWYRRISNCMGLLQVNYLRLNNNGQRK